jgi:hypothetical protein
MTLETQQTMGMSSVTEAPRWSEASPAARRVPALAVGRPASLSLVSADSTRLCFEGRRPMLAPLLLCPLFAGLGTLPWLASEPVDAARLATSGLFLLTAAGLGSWAWPRRQRLTLSSRGPAAAGEMLVQPGTFRWGLDVRHVPNALHASYSVTLEPDEGTPFTVLEGSDPERLSWQLSEVSRHWAGPIDCRWGLPASARPWSVEPHGGTHVNAGGGAERVVSASPPRGLIWCTRLMAAFVVFDVLFLIPSSGVAAPDRHPLSLVLPLLLVLGLLALALVIASSRSRLRIAARVHREDHLLGVRRQHGDIRIESVRGVHAVGHPAADRWHVLIDSSDGPLSLSVPRGQARALADQTERAIAAARAR